MTTMLAMAEEDGFRSLTWNNVCATAGVPRATASRAIDIIAEWKASVAALRSQAASPKERGPTSSIEHKAARDAVIIAALRQTVRTMGDHIQALTLALAKKDALIATLKGESGRDIVIMPVDRRS
ncbi:hypothetical protein QM467_06095 [Rhodoblastus sp. 17X3]|uniref:hypothetical protein n=1 Tax=Rhodoblastus sp. 17X3 TaxID=3047026 RepID=UPI0024B65C55|nr:hypothetical protein [Rhodoblastus sp. 17X3]MDI9847631.1 hypothetical protein [Rhodoblastus sp. 17X3]